MLEKQQKLQEELDLLEYIFNKKQELAKVLNLDCPKISWWDICKITNPYNPHQAAENLIAYVDLMLQDWDDNVYDYLINNTNLDVRDAHAIASICWDNSSTV